ncbi:MAG: ABC transporter ATP-binding protein [Nocardioidaceae bacterium]
MYRFYRAGEEETLALRGVSLTCQRGEIVAVTGPSGSGKSTLLACLAGLDEPSGGTVRIAGERISHRSEAERARLRAEHVGVLYQSGNLLDHLSVIDNVQLARDLGVDRSPTRSKPGQLLDLLGIGSRAAAWPDQLSGGEAARAGLAVALANAPDVLVADEPTGELDSASEDAVLDLLLQRARAGTAVVVASHSPAVAAAADQVVTLVDGVRQA